MVDSLHYVAYKEIEEHVNCAILTIYVANLLILDTYILNTNSSKLVELKWHLSTC